MTQDRTTMLFFEMFNTELPRQGPGDTDSTLKALSCVPSVSASTRVLDVGCGTGTQTLVLAQHSAARFTAVDTHTPFVDALNERAHALGLADRVRGDVRDMRELPFPDRSFDLIWCEGAIYNVGVEAGLRDWARLLAPGGHLAFTEVCWIKSDPPAECRQFWEREYSAIRPIATLLRVIDECGYETVAHFTLPPLSWWDNYYQPLQRNVTEFRERHRDEADALDLADQVQCEIDIWQAYSAFYSYEFFVTRIR